MLPPARYKKALVFFNRQRIDKSGTFTPGASTEKVTGWVSNSTYPATILSNALTVQGTKTGATINLSLVTQNSGNSGFIGIFKNGVQIPGASTVFPNSGSAIVTTVADVVQGDTLDVRANSVYVGRILEGTYLEVL